MLALCLIEPKPSADRERFDYYFEASAVIPLIVSLLLYVLSAIFLIRPFYQGNEYTKKQLIQSAIHRKPVHIPENFMIFWAIGFLIIFKLEFSNAVLAYAMVAFVAPIV